MNVSARHVGLALGAAILIAGCFAATFALGRSSKTNRVQARLVQAGAESLAYSRAELAGTIQGEQRGRTEGTAQGHQAGARRGAADGTAAGKKYLAKLRAAQAAQEAQAAAQAAVTSPAALNNQTINQAAQAPDNVAQADVPAIRQTLVDKLGMNDQESFNLSHQIAPGDNGGDCYVKLGADAVNFEFMSGNILRSPNGSDVVFVQSNTATPLVRCLEAVRSALGW
jgi:hypothetical protein